MPLFQKSVLNKFLKAQDSAKVMQACNENVQNVHSGVSILSKLQEMEWMEVFEIKQKEALALKAEIERVDKEIDRMVYELYGLTEEEIAILEGA